MTISDRLNHTDTYMSKNMEKEMKMNLRTTNRGHIVEIMIASLARRGVRCSMPRWKIIERHDRDSQPHDEQVSRWAMGRWTRLLLAEESKLDC